MKLAIICCILKMKISITCGIVHKKICRIIKESELEFPLLVQVLIKVNSSNNLNLYQTLILMFSLANNSNNSQINSTSSKTWVEVTTWIMETKIWWEWEDLINKTNSISKIWWEIKISNFNLLNFTTLKTSSKEWEANQEPSNFHRWILILVPLVLINLILVKEILNNNLALTLCRDEQTLYFNLNNP